MASEIKMSFHKRLFFLLLAFSWAIVLCFIGFQYLREKEYKSEFLNAQLQQYNRHLLETVEEGLPYEDYITTHDKPFDELRISIITLTGAVIYDNIISLDSLDNHRNRPEVASAFAKGEGYNISRQSASDGREYFYSATKGERVIVRTAIPYSNTLRDLLEADWSFLVVMISISLAMSIVAYFTTRRLGKDIERVNRYEAEQERNRLKRQLTNNINHELKTPVASIQVCLETLLSGINLSEEKRQELMERCYAHNNRLRRLLNDVSLITRMEDGSTLIGKERVVINDIIEEVAKELEMLPEDERLMLHTDFSDEVIVDGNPSLIGSIFRNLTENAIAYSEGKNIYISLLENNEKLCRIRFEDDGKGVEQKHLSRLFERFYRVDKGRSRQKGGTGLGLAIVKHAVQFHGGSITVTNRPNGGLRFEFTLICRY
ncbi:MAG: ATP-binding protein [Bacteroidales bacterium]|nr:ATP-binding protein [Bacteroidales bacterium]MBO5916041.1 ATP-binding protein [Bacteroidales bacterium]